MSFEIFEIDFKQYLYYIPLFNFENVKLGTVELIFSNNLSFSLFLSLSLYLSLSLSIYIFLHIYIAKWRTHFSLSLSLSLSLYISISLSISIYLSTYICIYTANWRTHFAKFQKASQYTSKISGRVAYWLVTCAWKPNVPGSSPAASYVQR